MSMEHDMLPPSTLDRAKQSMKDESDINNIVRRFVSGGVVPITSRPGQYLDVSEPVDYRTALDNVRRTDAFFMNLPSKVRARFNNDTAEFLDFIMDDSNEAEARELGLLPALEPGGGTPPPGRGCRGAYA